MASKMIKRKKQDIDDDGDITTIEANGEPVEAFVNYDLINDFADTYSPGSKYKFTHIFTRPQLRSMFAATIDFNTLDPLSSYIEELSRIGFKEQMSPVGEPCIYVVENDIEFAEVIDDE